MPLRDAGGDRREPARRGRARRAARSRRAAPPTGRRQSPADSPDRPPSVTTAATALGEDHARASTRPTRWPATATGSSCRRPTTARPRSTSPASRWVPSRPRRGPRWRPSSTPGRASGVDGWFASRAGLARRRRRHPRIDRALGRGAPGRGHDAQHADREPAPAVRDVLPAGRRRGRRSSSTPRRSRPTAMRSSRSSGCTAWTPARDLIVVRPRDGEALLRTEDLEAAIHEHRDRLAVALLAGVNYATGQVHDIERLTAAVHDGRRDRPVGPGPRRREHAARPARRGRRRRGVVHVQVPQRRARARSARLFVHERHATDAAIPAADRLVGQRPGDAVPDGRDVRPGGGRRRLADLDAADPVARAHPRVARDLRRGRHRCPATEVRSS